MSHIILTALFATIAIPGTSGDQFPPTAAPYALSDIGDAGQARDPLFADAIDMNGITSVRQLLAETAAMSDDARNQMLRATHQALVERLRHATGNTRKWLQGKLRIVEGAMDQLGIGH